MNGYTKTYMYNGVNQYQRINHFPFSNELTRKDKLYENINYMKNNCSQFDIIPETFVLPNDYEHFLEFYNKLRINSDKLPIWIIKPCNLSRGRGIYLTDKLLDIPNNEPCTISKYILNPLTLNGLKFDLRIYVVLTCLEPLRIYVYNEGLARFASENYDLTLMNFSKFIHLTNYSINKKNPKFITNTNPLQTDVGNKWSITSLMVHLKKLGVDIELLWSRIYDVIIKTIASGYKNMLKEFRAIVKHRQNCFELFGFDILIDSELKPFLIEVNLTPSLACDTPLDFDIKSHLIADLFTLIGIKPFDRTKDDFNTQFKNTLSNRSVPINYKHLVKNLSSDKKKLFNILHKFPSKIIDALLEIINENSRKTNFIRIYPSYGSNIYDKYFENPFNSFVYKIFYIPINDSYKVSLDYQKQEGISSQYLNPYLSKIDDFRNKKINFEGNKKNINGSNRNIRGDILKDIDLNWIICEYLQRIIIRIRRIPEEKINKLVLQNLEKFGGISSSKLGLSLIKVLENKILNTLSDTEIQNENTYKKFLSNLSSQQLEEILILNLKKDSHLSLLFLNSNIGILSILNQPCLNLMTKTRSLKVIKAVTFDRNKIVKKYPANIKIINHSNLKSRAKIFSATSKEQFKRRANSNFFCFDTNIN